MKEGKKYQLSERGIKMFDQLSGKDDSIMMIWDRIEKEIKKYAYHHLYCIPFGIRSIAMALGTMQEISCQNKHPAEKP